jgi:hypothetical protein
MTNPCHFFPINCLKNPYTLLSFSIIVEPFSRPPLSDEDVFKLKKIFQNVDSVSGQ